MDKERYNELMFPSLAKVENFDPPELTEKEISQGWCFCREWDGLLVGPGMPEKESCNCVFNKDQNQ